MHSSKACGNSVQAPQHRVIDGVLRWFALDFFKHPLQLEPAFEALAFDAQLLDELRQLLQTPGVGLAVDAAQERPILVKERPRDGFVGREHKLFDHLVTFSVHRGRGAADFAVGRERDADFAHRQFECAAREAFLTQHHR